MEGQGVTLSIGTTDIKMKQCLLFTHPILAASSLCMQKSLFYIQHVYITLLCVCHSCRLGKPCQGKATTEAGNSTLAEAFNCQCKPSLQHLAHQVIRKVLKKIQACSFQGAFSTHDYTTVCKCTIIMAMAAVAATAAATAWY